MISSPRLFALATLLAPVILFLVVHTAHGATRPTVRFTSAPAEVTAARSATLAIARSVPHGRVRAADLPGRPHILEALHADVRRPRPAGRPAHGAGAAGAAERVDGDGHGGLAGGHRRALGAAGAGRQRRLDGRPGAHRDAWRRPRPSPGVRDRVVPLADLDRRRRDLGGRPGGRRHGDSRGRDPGAVRRRRPGGQRLAVVEQRCRPARPHRAGRAGGVRRAGRMDERHGRAALDRRQRGRRAPAQHGWRRQLGRVRIWHPGRRDGRGRDHRARPGM